MADTMFLLSMCFMYIHTYLLQSDMSAAYWYLSPVKCTFQIVSVFLPLFASTLTIIVLCIERYVGICYPFKAKEWHTKRRAKKLCLTVWIIALLAISPMMVSCHIASDRLMFTGELFLSLAFSLAFLVSSVLYSLIVRELSQNCYHKAENRQVIHVLVATTVVYLVCTFPFQLASTAYLGSILELWCYKYPLYYHIHLVASVALIVNSSVNPLLYKSLSSTYRRAVTEAFGCRRKTGRKCQRNSLEMHTSRRFIDASSTN
ncbi:S-geranylgeranyl-glutathione receptor P2RY8-like [Saccoglossus kowalevskii]|uniref:P2Y purinoceptor 4-like n=1 Tax=Saccoglossus kowalevskii TaxID=10224 RepID=A0ABM0M252_SACKO|nr:PREDICTED: P2Y purinoceptor 4-like [Saccoglossus kowalevskii]